MQQDIVNSLLSLSTSVSHLEEDKERKVFMCPYCKCICVNVKLKGLQRYLWNGCSKKFSKTTGKF